MVSSSIQRFDVGILRAAASVWFIVLCTALSASGASTVWNDNIWRQNFGNPPGSGAASGQTAAVPEPAKWVIVFAALACQTLERHAKIRSRLESRVNND